VVRTLVGQFIAVCQTATGGDATAIFTDRDGAVIERTFNGDTRVNGEPVAYES